MIYTFYGQNEFLIDNHIKKIIKENDIEDININTYNLNDTLIEDIIDDALTISLFSDKKLIIVSDSYIFTGSVKKNNLEHNINALELYLKNDIENTILIFKVNNDKLDERKKIVKLLKTKSKVIEYSKTNQINSLVKDMFKEYNISNQDINYLVSRVGDNLQILYSEIEKIKIYKDTDLVISKEDIDNLTTKLINIDIFKFIENIILKNKVDAIETYHELIKLNEEPIKIIVMLANQIRLMYQVKTLSSEGYSEADLAKELNVHPYSAKKALQNSRNYSSIDLINNLNSLADLDIAIKTGTINKELGLELFILKL